MRYLVNGHETDLEPSPEVTVDYLGDRLLVKGAGATASALAVRRGDTVFVSYCGRIFEVKRPTSRTAAAATSQSGTTLAPMPGQIVDVFVEQGEQVEAGQKLLVLEAMKMQHAVTAPYDGIVSNVPVQKGEQVQEGQLLIRVDKNDG